MFRLYDRVLDTVTGKPCFVVDIDDHGVAGTVYGVESEDQADDDLYSRAL